MGWGGGGLGVWQGLVGDITLFVLKLHWYSKHAVIKTQLYFCFSLLFLKFIQWEVFPCY